MSEIKFYKFNVKVITPKHHMLIVQAEDISEAYDKAKGYLHTNATEWKKPDKGYQQEFEIDAVENDYPIDMDDPELHIYEAADFEEFRVETQDYVVVE